MRRENSKFEMKLVFMCLIALSLTPLSAQQGHQDAQYFLLPKDNNLVSLNLYSDNIIKEIAQYEKDEHSIYGTDGVQYVAFFDSFKLNLTIYDFLKGTSQKIGTPFTITAKSILVYKDNIYIGGFYQGTLTIQFNMKHRSWTSLAVPSGHPFLNRKAIDDLLIDGNTLIAVDNVVFPKFILYYKLLDDRAVYSHYVEIGSYDAIKFARISDKYIATLTYDMESNIITIHPKERMEVSFRIYGLMFDIGSVSTPEAEKSIFDACVILGNKLVIITRDKGLGLFEIDESFFPDNQNYSRRRDYAELIDYKKYNIIMTDKERLFDLQVIPQTNKVVVVLKDDYGTIRYDIIEVK